MNERIKEIAVKGAQEKIIFAGFGAGELIEINKKYNNNNCPAIPEKKIYIQVWLDGDAWMVKVFGKTYEAKEALKKEGFRWNGKEWYKGFKFEMNEESIITAFEKAVNEAIEVKKIFQKPY